MESRTTCHAELLLAKLSVAAAVSLIRSRPPGLGSRALAARLRERLRVEEREADHNRDRRSVRLFVAGGDPEPLGPPPGREEPPEARPTDVVAGRRHRASPVPGRGHPANSPSLVAVLSEVGALAERLRRAVQENVSVGDFPADEYHAIYRLLAVAEELAREAPASRLRRLELERTSRQLERQMLALWREFPLLAAAVWRMLTRLLPSSCL
ncbi:uncharacterized protein LOC144064330 [Stigmatopora argus]